MDNGFALTFDELYPADDCQISGDEISYLLLDRPDDVTFPANLSPAAGNISDPVEIPHPSAHALTDESSVEAVFSVGHDGTLNYDPDGLPIFFNISQNEDMEIPLDQVSFQIISGEMLGSDRPDFTEQDHYPINTSSMRLRDGSLLDVTKVVELQDKTVANVTGCTSRENTERDIMDIRRELEEHLQAPEQEIESCDFQKLVIYKCEVCGELFSDKFDLVRVH